MKWTMTALMLVLLCVGCSSGDSKREAEAIRSLEARVERLEKETAALRKGLSEAVGGIAEMQRGLSALKRNETVLAKPDADDNGTVTKDELDDKARAFASESLDRLLDLSRSVLDKIEQELEKMDEADPSGTKVPEGQEKEI